MEIKRQLIVLGLFKTGRYSVDPEAQKVYSHIGDNKRELVGEILPFGYTQMLLDIGFMESIMVRLHQLVYLWVYGPYDPLRQIDHIDRNPSNNHISNLRVVTPAENSRNKGIRNRLPKSEKEKLFAEYLTGVSCVELGKKYNVGRQTAHSIVSYMKKCVRDSVLN